MDDNNIWDHLDFEPPSRVYVVNHDGSNHGLPQIEEIRPLPFNLTIKQLTRDNLLLLRSSDDEYYLVNKDVATSCSRFFSSLFEKHSEQQEEASGEPAKYHSIGDFLRISRTHGYKHQLPFRKFKEQRTNYIHLNSIESKIVHQICIYMYYKVMFNNDKCDVSKIPEFTVNDELSVDMLLASDYLDI